MLGNLRHAAPGTPQDQCPLCSHVYYVRALLAAQGEACVFRWPSWFGAPGPAEDMTAATRFALDMMLVNDRGLA